MNHSVKDRQYICLLLNKLFNHIVPEDVTNQTEIAMEWLAAIRDVDGIMLCVRGGYKGEPFCVNTENNYMCFSDDTKELRVKPCAGCTEDADCSVCSEHVEDE
jgi:hypothetical protein